MHILGIVCVCVCVCVCYKTSLRKVMQQAEINYFKRYICQTFYQEDEKTAYQ